MSVDTINSTVEYTGNGSTTVFPITFQFERKEDIYAFLDDEILTQGPDYTITGGAVVTAAAVPAGGKLKIVRLLPLTQKISFQIQGPFDPKTVERGFDRATMILQQLNDGIAQMTLHGEQPGGNLHPPVDEKEPGFATPQMLQDIEDNASCCESAHERIDNLPPPQIEFVPDPDDRWDKIPVIHVPDEPTPRRVFIGGQDLPWALVSPKPTTLAGYGITDGFTSQQGALLGIRIGDLEAASGAGPYFTPLLRFNLQEHESVNVRKLFDDARSPYWRPLILELDDYMERVRDPYYDVRGGLNLFSYTTTTTKLPPMVAEGGPIDHPFGAVLEGNWTVKIVLDPNDWPTNLSPFYIHTRGPNPQDVIRIGLMQAMGRNQVIVGYRNSLNGGTFDVFHVDVALYASWELQTIRVVKRNYLDFPDGSIGSEIEVWVDEQLAHTESAGTLDESASILDFSIHGKGTFYGVSFVQGCEVPA